MPKPTAPAPNAASTTMPLPPSVLTLGWRLDEDGHPAWWMTQESRTLGHHSAADLVTVPSASVAAHTAIIAQSGAGKSFLLGNLIEEILLQTKARCIVFDPNADFRNVPLVKDQSHWAGAGYDHQTKLGWLPYDTHAAFSERWQDISIGVYFGPEERGTINEAARGDTPKEFKVWWPDVDAGILTDGLDVFAQSEVHHCHRFVRTVGDLMMMYSKIYHAAALTMNLVNTAEEYYQLSKGSAATLRKAIEGDFFPDGRVRDKEVNNLVEIATNTSRYVTEPMERFYFGKAKSLAAAGIVRNSPALKEDPPALRVLDLPSFANGDVRRLAISALLAEAWRSARGEWSAAMRKGLSEPSGADERTPTFIVVDEAHNLMPADPQGSADAALRDQFRTIVAEGRKYGLFLILVTQRPDKVDPLILSECENKALMRLGSESVVDLAVERLGLEGLKPSVKRCLDFKQGRAMVAGKWSKVPQEFFVGARRTVEGGSNLRAAHWAVPH